MSEWSLPTLLDSLHRDIQNQLEVARKSFAHPGTKGDASENIWIKLFNAYLPKRYKAEKAHVVDSEGNFSQQIDVVIFDRQYSPFIFTYGEQIIIPAESVYAVFEAKQTANAAMVRYAQDKVKSVRQLKRTSLPVPYVGGVYPPKELFPILGGLLTFESDWNPPFGKSFETALAFDDDRKQLDIGCVASHGHFYYNHDNHSFLFETENKPATAFLFRLLSMLQIRGTVPMIDIDAYAKWLIK